ncbi:ATPase [Clostridia bacterium]|nr:ATPase [Clostridia bacterium]
MYRNAIEQLTEWKEKPGRLPLLMIGARQVGKTWLLKQFGAEKFQNLAYISFDKSTALINVLESTVAPKDLLPIISAETGTVMAPGETLIVFDEIQISPRALLSLKYFCEEAPEYHIIGAGSTLGVMLHEHASFPVGKVEFLDLYPMSFLEFLQAAGEEQLVRYMQDHEPDQVKPFHEKLLRMLKQYFYVGGMPAVVAAYFENNSDFFAARKMQENILKAYDRDFSKYAAPVFAGKLRQVWRSVPSQLAKENKKFRYADVKKGGRGREYDTAIEWLKDSSMIGVVCKTTVPLHPLKSYEDPDAFKVFLNDIGLLSAMADLEMSMVAEPNALFIEFKGALAEQFVFGELRLALNKTVYYWSKENSDMEIDFLTQNHKGEPIAIEVKSGINLRSKSLKYYNEKYRPEYSLRTSPANFKIDAENRIIDIPLYSAHKIRDILEKNEWSEMQTYCQPTF